MLLDINTARGRSTLADEDKAVEIFEAAYPRVKYAHTDKTTMSKADAFLIRDGKHVRGMVLTSCRYNCSLATFEHNWNWEWLITYRKIALGTLMCRRLQMPLWGFLYIVSEDTLLINKLYDHRGRWTAPIRSELTATQATVNGGTIVRRNAFVQMDKALMLKRVPPLE